MKLILTFILAIILCSQGTFANQEITLNHELNKSWTKRIYINSLYAVSGLFSIELELSPSGKWTNSFGILHLTQNLEIFDYSITGISYRSNYYTSSTTDVDSWVFGVGLSIVYSKASFLFLKGSNYGLVPELNLGYKWNFKPVSLFLGAGYGVANFGPILNLGYSF